MTLSSRRWLRRLALPVFPLLIFLLCAEIGLRLAPHAIPFKVLIEFEPGVRSEAALRRGLQPKKRTISIARNDGGPSDKLWRYRGGATVQMATGEPKVVDRIVMDDEGFCNPDADAYAATNRFDVIALGDSFTFCTGVKTTDAWPARLAALTGRTVYNLGMPGRGLYEYLEMLKAYGLAKSPRIVVMGVYEGNDLRDAYLHNQSHVDPGRQTESKLCAFESEFSCELFLALKNGFLGRNSYAYNMASGVLANYLHRSEKLGLDFRYAVRFPDGKRLNFNSNNWDQDELQYAKRLTDGLLATSLFDDALRHFVALAERHDFIPVVVYHPAAHSTYEAMSEFEVPSAKASLSTANHALREYFLRRSQNFGYHYLDMTNRLRTEAGLRSSSDQLYFPKNLHYAPAGHELVARDLSQFLDEL